MSSGFRRLTEEEKRLWQYVTRGDTPLSPTSYQPAQMAAPATQGQPLVRTETLEHSFNSFAVAVDAPLLQGDYAGIDRRTAERFRKGEWAIDGTLDLHGLTREKGHNALNRFVREHYDRGSRCLLVITGKGMRHQGDDTYGRDGRGVLRELLPQWLATPGLQPLVLAFDKATPRHGGQGAFYVLLRRKRVTHA